MKRISLVLISALLSFSVPSYAGSSTPGQEPIDLPLPLPTPIPLPPEEEAPSQQQGQSDETDQTDQTDQTDPTQGQQTQPTQPTVPGQEEAPSQQTGQVESQSDALALHAIHIANVVKIRAGGIALLKPLTEATRDEAWDMVKDQTKSEIDTVILARQFDIKLSQTPEELVEFKAQLAVSLDKIKAAEKLDFENVYLAEIAAINEALIAELDHSITEGFVNTKVAEFVQSTYDTLQLAIKEGSTPEAEEEVTSN